MPNLLQWYPGHMTKARRELSALLPSQDVLIEVLDARLPDSSSNPLLRELRGKKPCVKVLHALCKDMALTRGPDKAVRALVVGVPNVGKSTLINVLMERSVAAVGDKPAITKAQQHVVMKSGMKLTDSPGIMWPKIEYEACALRLAFAGSIPDTAVDYLSVGMFGAGLLLADYRDLLIARFKLSPVPASPEALLEAIGRRRGGLRPGGVVDLHKAAEVFVHEFRSGAIGRITLDAPPRAD